MVACHSELADELSLQATTGNACIFAEPVHSLIVSINSKTMRERGWNESSI